MGEALPCPFCGKAPVVDLTRGTWMIFCPSSKHEAGTSPQRTRAAAMSIWNARVTLPTNQENTNG